jgi:hypothetical protein
MTPAEKFDPNSALISDVRRAPLSVDHFIASVNRRNFTNTIIASAIAQTPGDDEVRRMSLTIRNTS